VSAAQGDLLETTQIMATDSTYSGLSCGIDPPHGLSDSGEVDRLLHSAIPSKVGPDTSAAGPPSGNPPAVVAQPDSQDPARQREVIYKHDGGPAFPSMRGDRGMSLLDYFAATAMIQSFSPALFTSGLEREGAERCYRIADAMYREKQRRDEAESKRIVARAEELP
jgi:hypothetical protein